MTCPCGCDKPVSEGNRYATRGCYPRMHRAEQAARGRAGGFASGPARRRKAALARAQHVAKFITPEMRARLSATELARITALMVRCFLEGCRVAQQTNWRQKRRAA